MSIRSILRFLQPYWMEISLFSLSLLTNWITGPLIIDDAYIYFRYIDNFRNGFGLVFNHGQSILGFSSFLYPVFLIFPAILGFDIPSIAFYEGIIFQSLSTILIFQIGLKTKFPRVSYLGALFFAILPRGVLMSVSGMETSLMIFLLLLCLLMLIERHYTAASILAGLVAITRLEGILYGAPVLLFIFLRQRKMDWRKIILFIIPIIFCFIFSELIYDTWLPQTVIAKSTIYPVNQNPFENLIKIFDYLTYPILLNDQISINWIHRTPIILLLCWGGVTWIRKVPEVSVFMMGIFLITGVYAISNRFLFPWYLSILYPLQIMLFSMVAIDLWNRLAGKLCDMKRLMRLSRWINTVIILLLVFISLLSLFSEALARSKELNRREFVYAEIGNWMNSLAPEQYEIAAVDIGAIGFTYKGNIYDLVGITNPEVVPFYAEPDYQFKFPHLIPYQLIKVKQPQILVVYDRFLGGLITDLGFNNIYREIWRDKYTHPYYGTLLVLIKRGEIESQLEGLLINDAP